MNMKQNNKNNNHKKFCKKQGYDYQAHRSTVTLTECSCL